MFAFVGGAARTQVVRLVEQWPEPEREDVDTLLVLFTMLSERTVTAADLAPVIQKSEPEAEAVLKRLAEDAFWKAPYYRFERREHQHRSLRRLDRLLTDEAIVRYAAPAFSTVAELEAAVVTRSVLSRSGFVAPTTLGSHRVWTYTEPGTHGRANPSGRSAHFEAIEELLRLSHTDLDRPLPQRVDDVDALSEHLRVVAQAARDRAPRLRERVDRWIASVRRRDLLLSDEGLRRIGDLASISSLVAEIGARWSVSDRLDPPAMPAETN